MKNLNRLVQGYSPRLSTIELTFPGGESLHFRTVTRYGDIQRVKNGAATFARDTPVRGQEAARNHYWAKCPIKLIEPDESEWRTRTEDGQTLVGIVDFLMEVAPDDIREDAEHGWTINVLPHSQEDSAGAFILHALAVDPTPFSQVQALYACRAGWLVNSILEWWDQNKFAIQARELNSQVEEAGK